MSIDEQYDNWKNTKVHITVSESFAANVIDKIYEYENTKSQSFHEQEFSFLTNNVMRIAVAIAMSVLGVFRIVYSIANIIFP